MYCVDTKRQSFGINLVGKNTLRELKEKSLTINFTRKDFVEVQGLE